MGIGKRIKEKRNENKLTQSDLAKLVNVSSQVISNWEREYTRPNHEDVAKLSKALGVSTDYLLGRVNEPSILINDSVGLDQEIKKLFRLLINFSEPSVPNIKEIIKLEIVKNLSYLFNEYNYQKEEIILSSVTDESELIKLITAVNNNDFKVAVIKELRKILHAFTLKFLIKTDPIYEFDIEKPHEIAKKAEKLENILKYWHISYQGQILTNEERLRILEMLRILFPDKQNRK